MNRLLLVSLMLITCCLKAEDNNLKTLEGELEVLIEDNFETKQTRLHYNLIDNNSNKVYPLNIAESEANKLLTGQKVSVTGYWHSEPQVNKNKKSTETLNSFNVDRLSIVSNPTQKNKSGSRPTDVRAAMIVLVDFTDEQTSSYFTRAQIEKAMYSEVTSDKSANLATEHSSFFQARFNNDVDNNGSPDVFGPIQLPYAANSSCDRTTWTPDADQALSDSGVNLSQYRHRVYVYPKNVGCGWAGLAHVGCGTTCRAWIQTGIGSMPFVLAHELGHNLGSSHAATLNADGTLNEYGDKTDYMGSGYRPMNAAHRDLLGYYNDFPEFLLGLTRSSDVTITTMEKDLRDPNITDFQALKIPTSLSDHLYISYRKNEGVFGMASNFDERISIHRLEGLKSVFISHIGQGETFEDTDRGVKVEALATGGDTAEVRIIVNNQDSCIARKPSVAITESLIETDHSGTSLETQVNITNNDSSGCSARQFNLGLTSDAGLSVTSNNMSVSAEADGVTSIVLEATSELNAANGDYQFQFILTDPNAEFAPTLSGQATYRIVQDTTAPSAPNRPSVSATESEVTLNWTAVNDVDQLEYLIYRDNALIATTSDTTYIDNAVVLDETYSYYITARDSSGNESVASDTVDVQVKQPEDEGGAIFFVTLLLLSCYRLRKRV
ncbi:MAG: hypothetical protein HWE27_18035 [Gammaproteobacteria bacterium]|nr:hypothetical protein [Gammaproteobacteria bacterium]